MRLLLRTVSTLHRALYRLTRGRVGGKVAGMKVLLLTTAGRKSGGRRTVPLSYLEDGNSLVLIGSKGGAPTHPAWFLNLEANPEVEVLIGTERRRLRARRATQEEAAALWPRIVAVNPGYQRYREKTSREIPLVLLERL